MASNGHAQGLTNGGYKNGYGRGTYMEYGREYSRWHAGRYLFPVDETEMDRLDAMHKFFLVARRDKLCSPHTMDLDNLDSCPAEPQILDVGCGTGIWALDVARKFWNANENKFRPGFSKGVDACLDMQPKDIYPNSRLSFMDIEEDWTHETPENHWHLIHCRMLAGSISSWPHLYKEIFRHLSPGNGWVEHLEIDWNFKNDNGPVSPRLKFWMDELMGAMDQTGRPLRIDPQLTIQTLANTGFQDIRQEVLNIRVNGGSLEPWEIDSGRWFNLSLHKGFMAMSLVPLAKLKGWAPERIKSLEEEVLREIGERTNTTYCQLYIWTARRPGTDFR